jgi:hypothetical protein
MNTELNTPRTDAKVVICNYGEERVTADFARTLERELHESRNAERLARVQLGNERARLDWLEKRGPWESWNGFGETGITLRVNIRALIDAAMKEGK